MKKIIIPYIIIAFVFGVALIALGVYLFHFNLTKMLLESLEGAGIAGMVLYLVLYIPALLVRICTLVFIILGIPYLASTVLELIFLIKNKLSALKIVLRIFLIVNSVTLGYIGLTDIIFIHSALRGWLSGSVPFIVFTTIISVLCVALEIIVAIGFNKLKLMQAKMLSE